MYSDTKQGDRVIAVPPLPGAGRIKRTDFTWQNRLGQMFALETKKRRVGRRSSSNWRWPLDEVTGPGKRHHKGPSREAPRPCPCDCPAITILEHVVRVQSSKLRCCTCQRDHQGSLPPPAGCCRTERAPVCHRRRRKRMRRRCKIPRLYRPDTEPEKTLLNHPAEGRLPCPVYRPMAGSAALRKYTYYLRRAISS
jgi:hypothetical protein